MHHVVHVQAYERCQEDGFERIELPLQHRNPDTEERGDAQDRGQCRKDCQTKVSCEQNNGNKRYAYGKGKDLRRRTDDHPFRHNRVHVLDTMTKDRPLGA